MELFFNIIISSVGLSYFVYGKKSSNIHFLIFGVLLMFYSYLVQDLMFSLVLGTIFIICPFFTNKFL